MKKAEITISEYSNTLYVKLNLNGKLTWHSLKLFDIKKMSDFIIHWLMRTVRPVLFKLPIKDIKIICDKNTYDKFKPSINACSSMLMQTNDAIIKYKDLKGIAKDKKRILFFNVSEEIRYKSFYERLKRQDPSILYMNMDLGFNRIKREWEQTSLPLSLNELVEIIKTEDIGRLVSVNYYLLGRFEEKLGINLMAVLDYLGIEYISLINDPPDLHISGYLIRATHNKNDYKQFSNFYMLNKEWDDRYGLKNIDYVAIPQDYKSQIKMQSPDEDYSIVILSNSRWSSIKHSKLLIEHLLNHFPAETMFRDFQLWYMAMRYMVLNIMHFDEFERMKYSSLLHNFFYITANYLKYKIISWLETDREIKVYGDLGWKEICPEYYVKSLDNKEIDRMFIEENNLYLLLNFSFSYLDASAPVYDMIRRSVPFINVPPLVKTQAFEGMQAIEYTNKDELNSLIENAPAIFKNNGLQSTVNFYTELLSLSVDGMAAGILNGNNGQSKPFLYELEKHQYELNSMIEAYIHSNERFLQESFEGIFRRYQ